MDLELATMEDILQELDKRKAEDFFFIYCERYGEHQKQRNPHSLFAGMGGATTEESLDDFLQALDYVRRNYQALKDK